MDCPVCKQSAMITLELNEVEIDYCMQCEGIWLDAGELGAIRGLFKTEGERHKAAEEYFEDVFGDKLVAMQAAEEAKLEKTRRVANMFRFICPSYYVPGKQDWGGF